MCLSPKDNPAKMAAADLESRMDRYQSGIMSDDERAEFEAWIVGNPEAAALSGINTRAMTVKIFTLMGGLGGLAAVIASARLNSATNALGDLDELMVIAAAVVGGTSLAGGVGTIYGAIIGALVLVSLQTGMVLIGFGDGSYRKIVIGVALVLAVYLDILYRKRIK